MERKFVSSVTLAITPVLAVLVALGAWLVSAAVVPRAPAQRVAGAAITPMSAAAELSSALFTERSVGADAGVVASVERTPEAAGGELLRGETRFTLPGSGEQLRVAESARIDGFGRLDRAEVRLTYEDGGAHSAAAQDRILSETLDASGGVLSVTRASGRTETRAVPNALPWIYVPVALASGAHLSTPVAARVALRAAEVSKFAVELAAFEAEVSIASDQFLVPDGARRWLILDDDLAAFGATGDLLTLNVMALGLRIQQQSE